VVANLGEGSDVKGCCRCGFETKLLNDRASSNATTKAIEVSGQEMAVKQSRNSTASGVSADQSLREERARKVSATL